MSRCGQAGVGRVSRAGAGERAYASAGAVPVLREMMAGDRDARCSLVELARTGAIRTVLALPAGRQGEAISGGGRGNCCARDRGGEFGARHVVAACRDPARRDVNPIAPAGRAAAFQLDHGTREQGFAEPEGKCPTSM